MIKKSHSRNAQLALSRFSFTEYVKKYYSIAIPIGLYLLIMIPNLGFVALFDGSYYQECIYEASKTLLHPQKLFCYGHPAVLFFAPYAIAMSLTGGSIYAFNAVTILYGILGIIAFSSLVSYLVPQGLRFQRMLMTCVYVTHPLILASTLNVTADTGFMIFSVVFLACLFERRYLLAAVSGLFLIFSKEPGIIFLVTASGLRILHDIWSISLKNGYKKKVVFATWPLLIPLVAFTLYLATGAYKITYPINTNTFFKLEGILHADLLRLFFHLDIFDPRFLTFLGGIFILNFAWIASCIVAFALSSFLISFIDGHRQRLSNCIVVPESALVMLLLMLFIFALTRVAPGNNFRYLGPSYALFLLVFWIGFSFLIRIIWLRTAILTIFLLLQIASIYRTIDAVSKYIFGTFQFGQHKILILDKPTTYCCTYGIDEILYSFEFMTNIRNLQELAYAWIRPTGKTTFVFDTRLPNVSRIDASSLNASEKFDSSFLPKYLRSDDPIFISPNAPHEVFHLSYPNYFGMYSSVAFRQHYAMREERTFSSNGYELHVIRWEQQ